MASRRAHVTTACVPCRSSKIKCDAAVPACSHCVNKGKVCRYPVEDDKRKLTLKSAVDILSSRVEQLCQFISSNSLDIPPEPPDNRDTLQRIFEYQRIPYSIAENSINIKKTDPRRTGTESTIITDQTNHAPIIEAPTPATPDRKTLASLNEEIQGTAWKAPLNLEEEQDQPLDTQPQAFTLPPDVGDLASAALPAPSTAPTSTQEPTHTLSKPKSSKQDNTEALVDELSERVGSLQIGPAGHVRYYGPTSNFNLVKMPLQDGFDLHRTVRADGIESLRLLGLEKKVPLDLENELTTLYFLWQDPALHVVGKDVYEEAKRSWMAGSETPYFSQALNNAICALGAALEGRHHPTFVTFPRSLAEFFADRAKALLEIELDYPCIATVQALAVLSSHEVGCERDSRGWLYSGMAMRLAFALGLQVDVSNYVAEGSLQKEEAELRKDVFWGAYVIDHTWSFYLGRPFRINMEGATVSRPGTDNREPDDRSFGISPSEDDHNSLNSFSELHSQRVVLADIMAPIAYALYGNLGMPRKRLQEINVDTVARLFNWKDRLPPTLQVRLDDHQTAYSAHVLLLHMQYHQNMIHAHRPYMSRTYTQPVPPQGPGSDHARMMCMESASSIAKILQLYEIRYPLRRMAVHAVGIVCSAALLLVFQNITNYQGVDTEVVKYNLSTCFRALEQFELSWESARRARDFLLLLQRQWELRSRDARAGRSQEAAPEYQPRKRARTFDAPETQASDETVDIPPDQLVQPSMLSSEWQGAGDFVDMENELDLDWISSEFPFAMPPGLLDRL